VHFETACVVYPDRAFFKRGNKDAQTAKTSSRPDETCAYSASAPLRSGQGFLLKTVHDLAVFFEDNEA